MAHPFEATAYVEQGWWLVHAVDIGKQTHVGTLAEVENAARGLYAGHLLTPISDIAVKIHVYRSTPAAVVRARWTQGARRLRVSS